MSLSRRARFGVVALAFVAICSFGLRVVSAVNYQTPHVAGVWTATNALTPIKSGQEGHWTDSNTFPRFDDTAASDYLLVVPPASLPSTKGDLVVGAGMGATPSTLFTKLSAGSNGQCLTAQSAQTSGLQWAACGGGSATLATAYSNGAAPSDETMVLNNTNKGVLITDNGTPITPSAGLGLFDVTDSTKAKLYFDVTKSGINSFGAFGFAAASYPTVGNGWLYLANTTAATGGAQTQNGPDIVQEGKTWDGAASQTIGAISNLTVFSPGSASYTTHQNFVLERAASTATALQLEYDGANAYVFQPKLKGALATGATALDFSGSTGTFKTSTGAATFGGASNSFTSAITIAPASNQITLGTTNVDVISATAPAAASNTLTIPDTGGADTFAFTSMTQTLASKTLTAPVINGATSSGSTAINFSGNSGTFSTPTGVTTISGGLKGARRAIADAAATITSADFIVGYSSITATRIATLPNATAGAGTQIYVGDESGSVTTAIAINVQSAGGTIDGIAAGTGVNIVVARCFAGYESDGTNWHTIDGGNCYSGVKLVTPAIVSGLTASGSTANDFSASTGTFLTSTGANTLSGSTTLAAAKTLTLPPRSLIDGAGTAPTCALLAAAGSTSTCNSITGTDTDFKYVFTASGTGWVTGDQLTFTFNGTWGHTPMCHVQPASSYGGTLAFEWFVDYAASSTTTVKIGAAYGPTIPSAAITFLVHCFDPGV